MITAVDIETTVFMGDPSPYSPNNKIVSVGWKCEEASTEYVCLNHNGKSTTPNGKESVQSMLDKTTLLVGHNIKFDLSWLLECSFTYTGEVYDTMIYEYLDAGGMPVRLNLSACCKRHGIGTKLDAAKSYFNDGIGFEDMPWSVVEEYGRNDVEITWELYHKQQEILNA